MAIQGRVADQRPQRQISRVGVAFVKTSFDRLIQADERLQAAGP